MAKPLLLDGVRVAETTNRETERRVQQLCSQGVVPCLATVLVGDNPASETYVRMKGKMCERLGMKSLKIHLPEETTTAELIQQIEELNSNTEVHGILLQHPVPSQINGRQAFDAIAIDKDVDGVTSWGFGQMAMGFGQYPSCTPAGIVGILDYYQVPIEGAHAVVVGRSPILGKPMAMLLLERNATVTICHSRTRDLPNYIKTADIVVAAVGKPKFIQGDWIKEGAVVIDAGYNKGNVGDVDFASCAKRAGAITPVPGGPGPVTIAYLMKHTVDGAERGRV